MAHEIYSIFLEKNNEYMDLSSQIWYVTYCDLNYFVIRRQTMKRIRILTMAIALILIGLIVVPQVFAQNLAEMQRELLQVQQDLQAGRITEAQAAIRMNEINQKYLGGAGSVGGMPQASTSGSDAGQAQNQRIVDQATQTPNWMQQPQQQQAAFPTGRTSGWPSTSIFQQVSLPNLQQPSGTMVSYDYDSQSRKLTIYIRNGTQRTLDELARAINSSHRGGEEGVRLGLQMPAGLRGYNNWFVELELGDGGVTLSTGGSAQ
jgi:hypothetical protein